MESTFSPAHASPVENDDLEPVQVVTFSSEHEGESGDKVNHTDSASKPDVQTVKKSSRRSAADRGSSFCSDPSDGSPLTRSMMELKARRDKEVDTPLPLSGRISIAAGFLVARHPCKALCSCCGLILAITLAGVLSGELAFSGEGSKDWQILDDKHTLMRDAVDLAKGVTDCIQVNGTCPEAPIRSRANMRLGLTLNYYSTETGSTMFTPERLQQACEIERLVLENPHYTNFCILREDRAQEAKSYNTTDCQPPSLSVVGVFYGGIPANCTLLPEAKVRAVTQMLLSGLADPATRLQTGFFLEAGTQGDEPPRMTRSLIALGYPFEGFETLAMDDRSVVDITKPFWDRLEQDLLAYFNKKHGLLRTAYWEEWVVGDVGLIFNAFPLGTSEQQRVVNSDTSFVLVAVLFVWACLCVHTGSTLVGSISLLQILFSIPVAFFFYRFVGQITFFQQLHAILIFIMLGVGADSVFVFSDAWHQSEELLRDAKTPIKVQGQDEISSLAARIALAYQRTLVSVFNTSFTTGVAFLATAISPIMPIRTMGIFACLLVVMNYIFVITLTPAVFAVWASYGLSIPLVKVCRRTKGNLGSAKNDVTVMDKPGEIAGVQAQPQGQPQGTADPSPQEATQATPVSDSVLLDRCFLPLFNRPAVAALCVLALAGWGAANCYFASRLEPPPEMFQYFGKEHMQTKAQELGKSGFVAGTADDYLTLQLSFGVQGVDRSPGDKSVDPWKPHLFSGVQIWDDAFDLAKPEAQDFLRGFCARLRVAPCSQEVCADGLLFQNTSSAVSCFIEEFDAWNGGKRSEGQEFLKLLAQFRREQKPLHKLNGRATWEDQIGFVEGELRYVKIQAQMTARSFLPSRLKEGVLNDLEEWLEEESLQAPASVGTILQTAGFDWIFYALEKALVDGLFNGFAICFPVSFTVLLFATGNIVVALLAIVTIILIVMGVLGWCWVVEGWYLGVSESIAGIIVIGLAVDYVIHLGHMYLEMGHLGYEKRAERWTMALKSMGITVLAGAATTFMAGLSMRLCQMTFFTQMSTLISVTIGYSLVYTLFFFMCVLRLAGPEGNFGDIGAVGAWVWSASRTRFKTPAKQSTESE
eukprot:TRINITY_DN1574_c0_g1_i1.p1 TRINITY_DN1574_c0_g1~~TRINITY_DN1574_c0_g1_i1.p1  ORF type:complete len:1112 (-),score=207.49 TRINITY_DN1574_c0_g1_i1:443-3733(-)